MTFLARTVAITGAGGFLGKYFSARLRERGYAVRALSSQKLRPESGLEVVTLTDTCDVPALERALRGADAVIHLAGLAHVRQPGIGALDAYVRANVGTVDAVSKAAQNAGLSCMVLMSSAAVVGEQGDALISLSTPLQPSTVYGQTKLEGEIRARDRLGGSAVRLRIIRPPMVYGPGMRGNPLRLFSLVDRGVPIPVGGIQNQRSIISSGNLLDAVEATIRSDDATGPPLYVSDAVAPSTPELVRAIARALRRRARIIPLPHMLLRGLDGVASHIRPSFPAWIPARLDDLRRLTSSFVVDSTPARDQFGIVPRLTLADGLSEAAEWWRDNRR